MDKEKRKSVLVTNDLHLELRQLQLDALKKGKEKTMSEIIEEGLKALAEKKQA